MKSRDILPLDERLNIEEANAYHESIKPNTYTVELPKGYEVKREYVILGNIELIDGIFLKLKHI